MEELWKKLQNWLRSNMSISSYDTWVRQLSFKGIYGSDFVISTPNESAQLFLDSQYKQVFSNGLAVLAPNSDYRPVFVFGAENELDLPNLNLRYTFDNFVVGSNNNFAYAAARSIAEGEGNYNPFLIYGGPGLGKTHLMHAIGNRIKERNPSARILYVTCEEFTNDLVRAIQTKQNESFRNRYRHVDVLLVDDIQFIAGRTSSQEEFFHTFNALYNADKQIVMTSDMHPQYISTLEERLRSRFIAGLCYDIQLPDIETRVAILKSKLAASGVTISDDALFFIAGVREANVRELEGYLTRVLSYANLAREEITVKLCENALQDILPKEVVREITMESITKNVALYYSVRTEDIFSKKRTAEISFARMAAMYLCRTYTDKSFKDIGAYYGNRDHTTVMHANDKFTELVRTNAETRTAMEEIIKKIRSATQF